MSELQGIARIKFHEGKLEEFERLAAQCMEIVRAKDTGTLQYDVYFNDDQTECVVLGARRKRPERNGDHTQILSFDQENISNLIIR